MRYDLTYNAAKHTLELPNGDLFATLSPKNVTTAEAFTFVDVLSEANAAEERLYQIEELIEELTRANEKLKEQLRDYEDEDEDEDED